jgi:hypothetical protein
VKIRIIIYDLKQFKKHLKKPKLMAAQMLFIKQQVEQELVFFKQLLMQA